MLFETKRLIIREFSPEDAAAVHVYASDPEVTKHMIWGPNTEEETGAFINRVIGMQKQKPRLDHEFAVVLKQDGTLIGGCGIYVSEPLQGEIGYCINPRYWRKGYASEAAAEMLRFGFKELGLHRIYATCRPDNTGSAKVMQKAGMTYEGRLRGHIRAKGQWIDSLQFSILEGEYESEASEG
ncbi:GNAT family N-acetyltransferase [Paenibacillus tarimensis]